MPTPVRVAFEPAASPDEIAAVLTVLEALAGAEPEPERSLEPAWRTAARREATGTAS